MEIIKRVEYKGHEISIWESGKLYTATAARVGNCAKEPQSCTHATQKEALVACKEQIDFLND